PGGHVGAEVEAGVEPALGHVATSRRPRAPLHYTAVPPARAPWVPTSMGGPALRIIMLVVRSRTLARRVRGDRPARKAASRRWAGVWAGTKAPAKGGATAGGGLVSMRKWERA